MLISHDIVPAQYITIAIILFLIERPIVELLNSPGTLGGLAPQSPLFLPMVIIFFGDSLLTVVEHSITQTDFV
jgi:hypothetical protein